MKHRGRIQAQGEDLEASEAWTQIQPPTKADGIAMVEKLRTKIPPTEARIREKAFDKARKFIQQGPHEAISAPIVRSFKVKSTKKERVDIEIHKGVAFT